MAVYFSNDGNIELDVIRTMGVNVKENDNPIGFFGTGLKYAIATLLRTGHHISLFTDGKLIEFSTREKLIRGKPFQMIYMDDEQLGFTTDLGKNWEVWQAYRELYSNTIDENGIVTRNRCDSDTIFMVKGPEIDEVHDKRGEIFLLNEPWYVTEGLEIHRGASWYVYYRGIRIHKLTKQSRFTYNLTCPVGLTEDRTIGSVYDMNYKLACRLPRVTLPEICASVIDPLWDGMENALDFSDCFNPSEEFLSEIEKVVDNSHLNENTRNLLKNNRPTEEFVKFTPTDEEWSTIRSACSMLYILNAAVRPDEINFVENLGPGVVALAKNNEIYISRQCLANGKDYIAITLYEEWIHNKMGYHDESRGMQQFLFDKILELMKREVS